LIGIKSSQIEGCLNRGEPRIRLIERVFVCLGSKADVKPVSAHFR
jgi:hypothetical protein